MTPVEKENMASAANLVASKLNRSYCGKNTSSMAKDVGSDAFNENEGVNAACKDSSTKDGGNQQSQSTFVGLFDFVHDIFEGSQTSEIPVLVGRSGNNDAIEVDYDIQQDDDDAQFEQFEENVVNPRIVKEFDDMGFKGDCSDDGGNLDQLESLCGSKTKEDENGNPLPKR
ncbi:hypothetical protein M0R45_030562 [Rubus argutus]|uniref:Uncharacterized protein n=1 Tax=Rubus argutus TaxID=59490 RepID=A0AAW1WBS7_RUBAR